MTHYDKVLAAMAVDGLMTHIEVSSLVSLAHGLDRVVEIGSWKGRSTKALALSANTMYAVDDFSGAWASSADAYDAKGQNEIREAFKHNLRGELDAKRCVLIETNSATNASHVRELILENGPVDLVFIDGDHSEAGVLADIDIALDILKPGGVVCGHDVNLPGVHAALCLALPGWTLAASPYTDDNKIWIWKENNS